MDLRHTHTHMDACGYYRSGSSASVCIYLYLYIYVYEEIVRERKGCVWVRETAVILCVYLLGYLYPPSVLFSHTNFSFYHSSFCSLSSLYPFHCSLFLLSFSTTATHTSPLLLGAHSLSTVALLGRDSLCLISTHSNSLHQPSSPAASLVSTRFPSHS